MPAITITAVNTATEEITAVAHGLTTGDRFRLRNVGGALPAATPALAQATDYFAVRTGVDTLKISDTNAHALADTGIFDLTGAGSGTNTVEYGLPYCIPTALAAAMTQIKSANDQGAWNALVAIYSLLVGLTQSVWTAITIGVAVTLSGALTVVGAITAAAATFSGLVTANNGLTVVGTLKFVTSQSVPVADARNNAGYTTSADVNGSVTALISVANASSVQFDFPVRVGDRITGFNLYCKKSSGTGNTLKAQLFKNSGTNSNSTALGSGATNAANNPGAIVLSESGINATVAAGESFFVAFWQSVGPTTLQEVYSCEIDLDRP